ncbi:MAG TPA: T9SS type A sorting domain-containing protein [Bacteroidales bacterium]|nr:T9SS type A sorting domain-containing protein [Bacteroidales bacterium]HPS51636.1 T9SS type A sorting domain-containing protein [Bacteroidales bacterium]
MKKISFLFLLLAQMAVFAQVTEHKSPGDTIGPFTTITFEEPSANISVVASPTNIWQIGVPQKTLFNQAWSLPKAIVTDTMGNYPENNHSIFEFGFGPSAMGGFYAGWFYYSIFIDFRHQYDTDTLQDGGYISVSWDAGQTFMNILDDTISQQYYYSISPLHPEPSAWGNTNLYQESQTLFNGEHGFSGKSDGWVQSCMAWYAIPVKNPFLALNQDTLIFRFNFISDNIPSSREGWMIDQIRLFSIDIGGGIREVMPGTQRSFVTPNPAINDALVTLNKIYQDVDFQLYNNIGKCLERRSVTNSDQFTLDVSKLPSGTYFLKILLDRQYSETRKIMILR